MATCLYYCLKDTQENEMNIDKWFADSCGIHLFSNNDESPIELWTTPDGWVCIWLISDARCREVIREKFNISTEYDLLGTWTASSAGGEFFGQASTIMDAELACLQVIYDTRDA